MTNEILEQEIPETVTLPVEKETVTFKLFPGYKVTSKVDQTKPFEANPIDAEKWQKKGYGIIVGDLINDSILGEIQKTEDPNVILWNGELWKKLPKQSTEEKGKEYLTDNQDNALDDEKVNKKGKK